MLAEIVPATGTIEGGATGVYWKSRRLPSTDKQTHTPGVDKTTVTTGTDITRVRYWGKAWQYSSDGSVPGIEGRVDLDLCLTDFSSWGR